MKRAGFYVRVSTLDQHPETQLRELREYAERRGLNMAGEYVDHGVGGAKARRPALDRMLEDARMRRFDTLIRFRHTKNSRCKKCEQHHRRFHHRSVVHRIFLAPVFMRLFYRLAGGMMLFIRRYSTI